jgi:serine/threonine-protein kinase HipA
MNSNEIKNCLGTLKPGFSTYSGAALKKIFDSHKVSHILPFQSSDEEGPQHEKFIDNRKHFSIAGVQEKLSLRLDRNKLRLTREGEFGQYLLKPIPRDIKKVSQVPANEHLTTQIAKQVFDITTAECCLIFFDNGKPAFLSRRFDVKRDGTRLLQEDFASVAGKTNENSGDDFKYDYDYLSLGNLIRKNVNAADIELEKYFKLVVFNYLFSNGDAHLKNFSLLESATGDYILSPAYDLLCTRIHVPETSDFALKGGLSPYATKNNSYSTLGYYGYDDFFDFGIELGLKEVRVKKIMTLLTTEHHLLYELIQNSFLNTEIKPEYISLYKQRLAKLSKSLRKENEVVVEVAQAAEISEAGE